MAGELDDVVTHLVYLSQDAYSNNTAYNNYRDNKELYDLGGRDTLIASLYTSLKAIQDRLVNLGPLAVTLRDTGEWWKNVDIATLKSDLLTAIGVLQTANAGNLLAVHDDLQNSIDGIGSGLRWALWPDFSYLESSIKSAINSSKSLTDQSLGNLQNVINQFTTGKAGEIALAIANTQSAVLIALTEKSAKITSEIGGIVGTLTATVQTSQKVVSDALTATENRIKTFSSDLAKKTEDMIAGLFNNMGAFFSGAADDIAKRIWEYFRDFFFKRVE